MGCFQKLKAVRSKKSENNAKQDELTSVPSADYIASKVEKNKSSVDSLELKESSSQTPRKFLINAYKEANDLSKSDSLETEVETDLENSIYHEDEEMTENASSFLSGTDETSEMETLELQKPGSLVDKNSKTLMVEKIPSTEFLPENDSIDDKNRDANLKRNMVESENQSTDEDFKTTVSHVLEKCFNGENNEVLKILSGEKNSNVDEKVDKKKERLAALRKKRMEYNPRNTKISQHSSSRKGTESAETPVFSESDEVGSIQAHVDQINSVTRTHIENARKILAQDKEMFMGGQHPKNRARNRPKQFFHAESSSEELETCKENETKVAKTQRKKVTKLSSASGSPVKPQYNSLNSNTDSATSGSEKKEQVATQKASKIAMKEQTVLKHKNKELPLISKPVVPSLPDAADLPSKPTSLQSLTKKTFFDPYDEGEDAMITIKVHKETGNCRVILPPNLRSTMTSLELEDWVEQVLLQQFPGVLDK